MSFRPSYYGGFPGPPANLYEQQTRHQDQRRGFNPQPYGQPLQDVAYYPDPTASSFFPPRNLQPPYNGRPLYHSEFGFAPNSQFYSIHQPPEYYFEPNYNINSSPPLTSSASPATSITETKPVQYTGSQPSKSLQHVTSPDAGVQKVLSVQDSSSTSSSGKSRRFSHQRNVKDSAPSGTSGEMFSPVGLSEEEREPKRMGKHSIRFSHQREIAQLKKRCEPSTADRSSQMFEDKDATENGAGQASKQKGIIHLKENAKKKKSPKILPVDSRNQASVLVDQLTYGSYECMVCCDRVRPQHAVWNCATCYNLFHMGCIKKWARSPAAKFEESGWRCPGCQHVTKNVPNTYFCYCGKVRDPDLRRGEVPHSCGEVCGRSRKENTACTHSCNILCHPGPCPQCPAMINKRCKCGKVSSRIRCSQQMNFTCDKPCGKLLNCGVHKCEVVCHSGSCDDCDVIVEQVCYCGENQRSVVCGSDEHATAVVDGEGVYSCGGRCGKQLACGNHFCKDVCHIGPCKTCSLLPSAVTVCPCTQTKLKDMKNEDGTPVERVSCSDPVPTCDKICGKPLRCGGDDVHLCQLKCHEGVCPPCKDGVSNLVCRCGKSDKDVKCKDFIKVEHYRCDKRCNKKRRCGKHKCGKVCCVDKEHQCTQRCGRKLTCGLHSCEEICHRGSCHTCYDVSFDELRCHCGSEVIFPPIPCGTKPPECQRECTRIHSCTHEIRHTCHSQPECPPCIELVKKPCNCGRIIRSNIMCHITNVSCGEACAKTLPCGHKCIKPCHRNACLEEGERCKQPCSIMRAECIHPCASPCHSGDPCPTTPCKAMVTLKCPCARREEHVECSRAGASVQGLNSAISTSKNPIDLRQFLRPGTTNYRSLSCDEECAVIARNKRLAEALNIDTDDYSSAPKVRYSDFLLSTAKNDGAFVRMIEKELMNLVEKVQWMSIAKHSHAFPPMKKEKRQVVHELSEAFKCKSESHDYDPKRNVTVTAEKGVSKHPTPLLSEVMVEKMTAQKNASPKPTRKGSVEKSRGNDVAPKQATHFQSRNVNSASSSAPYKPPHRSLDPLASTFPPSKAQGQSNGSETSRMFSDLSLTSGNSDRTTSSNSEDKPSIDYFDMTD